MSERPPSSQGTQGPSLLYVGAQLPKLSETFVTRELLGLRRQGYAVHAASLRAPEDGLGDEALERLGQEALPVYGAGAAALLRDALAEVATNTEGAAAVLRLALRDALLATDLPLGARPKLFAQAAAALALARRARPLRVSHVHAHMAHAPATVAMYVSQALGVSWSFTGHAADLFRDRALLSEKLARASFVACISRWHRAFYRRSGAITPDRLPLVRCGVDPHEFEPAAERDPRLVAAVGRLVDKKGFDVLIEAMAALRARDLDLQCVIVGEGPQRARLEARCRALGLEDRVELVGARPNGEVRRLLARSAVTALPCRTSGDGDRDGIPVVLMEAMASESAVVAGDLPTIRELVVPEETGLVVPPGDPAALARAIERLARDEVLRRRLATAGRRRVLAEFSADVNLRRLRAALSRALGTEPDWRAGARTAAREARAAVRAGG